MNDQIRIMSDEAPEYASVTIILENSQGSKVITFDKVTEPRMDVTFEKPQLFPDGPDSYTSLPGPISIENIEFNFRPLPNNDGEYMQEEWIAK